MFCFKLCIRHYYLSIGGTDQNILETVLFFYWHSIVGQLYFHSNREDHSDFYFVVHRIIPIHTVHSTY